MSRFVRNFSTIVQPLRELTKSDVKWQWGSATGVSTATTQRRHDKYYCHELLQYKMRTEVSVDASPVGLGAILAQREDDSTEPRIVAYESRALTPVERRYSQI